MFARPSLTRRTVGTSVVGTSVLTALLLFAGSGTVSFHDTHKWGLMIARYVFYVLLIRGTRAGAALACEALARRRALRPRPLLLANKPYLCVFAAAAAALLYSNERLLEDEFLMLFVAHLVIQYLEMETAPSSIRYGIGMACSFFEGYLAHVLPNDGASCVGFQENIRNYEDKNNIVFPVKVLFIIITKSMYCPPDLREFNKRNTEDILPYMEACESLKDVNKDVAGVKNRSYRNTAYKIHRPGLAPVYLAAECATPLHTLYKVLQRRALYEELRNIDTAEVVRDFSRMLRAVVAKSPECAGKCQLVFFDDTDPSLNLADVLLDKIRELEPNFEAVMQARR